MQNKFVSTRTDFTSMPAYETAIEFFIGRASISASADPDTTIGSIFVSYEVELQDPQPASVVTQ